MNKKEMKYIKIGLAALLAAGPMGVVAQDGKHVARLGSTDETERRLSRTHPYV